MKKLIAIVLSLVMLLSMAACASKPETTDPTENTTEAPPESTGDIIIGNDETTEPSQEATEPPVVTPEMNANGYCAVGIINAEAGTVKVLADNGAIAEIPYTSDVEIRTGMVYGFAKNGDVYTLSKTPFINADYSAWNVRVFDNEAMGAPDGLYTHDGVTETFYDLAEDCVIFCRFSETEWRIFRGSDAIKYSDWPCGCYFTAEENPTGGNKLVTVMLVCSVDSNTWIDGNANEASTYFFDEEGFGWSNGDLIIE